MVAAPRVYSIVCRFRDNVHDKCSRVLISLVNIYQHLGIKNAQQLHSGHLKIEDSRKTFPQIHKPWWLYGSVHPWACPWPTHGLKIWRKVLMESSIFNLQTAIT